MRLLALALLVVLIDQIHPTESTRAKRDLDVMGGFCILECVYDHINHSMFSQKRNDGGSMICKHAEIHQLEEVCGVFNKRKACLSDCPEGPLKSMVLQAATYGCETHFAEFQKYTPCFTESCPFLENACRPKCGTLGEAIHYTPEQKSKLDNIRRFGSHTPTTSSGDSGESGSGVLDVLQNINIEGACKFINCYLDCSEKPLTEKCGKETYNFFKRVVVDFTPMVFTGFFPNMTTPPEECQKTLDLAKTQSPTGSSWRLNAPSILASIVTSIFTVFVTRLYRAH